MTLRLGMDVLYTATAADVAAMKSRRDDHLAYRRNVNATVAADDHLSPTPGDLDTGRSGHMAHVGNELEIGRSYAAKIVRVWGTGTAANLQVFLDGTDTLWVTSVSEGDGPGQYVMA